MPVKQINTSDKDLQLIQSSVAQVVDPIEKKPFVKGNLVTNVALVTGQDNLVSHGLGSNVTTWAVASLKNNAIVWEEATAKLGGASANDKFINLKCSANCTLSIWVN